MYSNGAVEARSREEHALAVALEDVERRERIEDGVAEDKVVFVSEREKDSMMVAVN